MTTGPYWVGDIPSSGVQIAVTRDGFPAALDDFNGVEVALYAPSGAQVALDGVEGKISAQNVIVDWPSNVSPFPVAGVYALQVTLVGAMGQREAVDPVLITVKLPSAVLSWATPQKVKAVTGVEVSQDQIEIAVALIEAVTGKDLTDPSAYSLKNLRIIGSAVSYQAAYLTTNPTIMNEITYGSVSVGDVSRSNPGNGQAGSLQLAPMARIALNKVSWRGMRTIVTPKLQEERAFANPLLEADDDLFKWTPVGQAYPQHRMGRDI